MKCEDFLFLIDDLIEGEFDASTADAVNLHLFACPACAAEYELMREEKEIYRHYWFDSEPSKDLLAEFQTKLKTGRGELPKSAVVTGGAFNWSSKIANLFRLSPAAAMASLVILFLTGFALLSLVPNHVNKADESAGRNELETAGSLIKPVEINEDKPAAAGSTGEKADNFPPSKIREANEKSEFPSPVKTLSRKSLVSETKPKDERSKLNKLATETAEHVEKIELFLRSFRNAEAVEDGKTYDITYEKLQARNLLKKNLRLRQNAENHRTFYPEELLNKAEPLLIEIANLENTPPAEKVLDIKERLKNQNLIVSLQAY